tara:strand:+ start:231 stop:500 length:270 start_codon:yes stop_codon:yes gene_type:complete
MVSSILVKSQARQEGDIMNIFSDSITCIGFAVLFYFTLAFFGLFLGGCWSLAVGNATGLQIFSLLFIGGLFTLLGTIGLGKIWEFLLNQ